VDIVFDRTGIFGFGGKTNLFGRVLRFFLAESGRITFAAQLQTLSLSGRRPVVKKKQGRMWEWEVQRKPHWVRIQSFPGKEKKKG